MWRHATCLCLILALEIIGACQSQSAPPVIEAIKAKEYVGQEATVCGHVVSARYAAVSRGSPTFLNFERPYPDHVFTAVIWGSAFGEAKPWQLGRLPHTRREVEQIARLYAGSDVALFTGEQAREESVKAERLERYRFVHFAAHGLLNENAPPYSGIVLSLPPAGKREAVEDGLLQVYEIFNLKLNADMVVLSACETGLGKEVRGEGMVGLTRAFLYAGAQAVVVSLWKVADVSTAELMVRFYRHLKAGMSKAEALRRAKLGLLEEGRIVHPFHWAPFILVGKS